ncbi:DNA polymerase III subunit psi [Pasteurellaceae bacterium LIM206]|nr:DNA polymerase III subunit psi [Pasteurellaceae bacterium LIM206]
MNRRDLLLQQMDISQWRLRRPEALKGAMNIVVAAHVRLIVIAEQVLSPQDGFVRDVLTSADVRREDCLFIDFTQADYLKSDHAVHYWLLTQNSPFQHRTLPFCQPENLWQSPALLQLKQDAKAKRQLWQQIQHYVSHSPR